MSRRVLVGVLVALAFFTLGDHSMRLDQQHLCEQGEMPCPAKLWWFQ